jgi:hypothetical protein
MEKIFLTMPPLAVVAEAGGSGAVGADSSTIGAGVICR